MARILIVDDTAVVREPISAVLASAGFQTESAEDGAQALAKMRARAPGRSQRRVEPAVFGLQYSDLVQIILSRLGLPGVVTAPIQEFFEREAHLQPSGAGSPLGRSLRIANIYAHGLMLAPGLDEPVLPLSKVECRNTYGDQIPGIDDGGIRAESLTTAAILAGLSGAETGRSLRAADSQTPDSAWLYAA